MLKWVKSRHISAQVQKEQGSLGLFGGKGELIMANKVTYKQEDKKVVVCEHCKKRGHIKDKCWILHPHLKPAKFKVNISQEARQAGGSGSSKQGEEVAMAASHGDIVRKSDL